MAHLLRLAIFDRYDPEGWACTDFPPAVGETPVGGIFVKQRCEKATPERHLLVETRLLRKPGQSDVDPMTGEYSRVSSKAGHASRFSIRNIGSRRARLLGSPAVGHDGAIKFGAIELGIGQDRIGQVGALKIGAAQIRPIELGTE